MGSASSRKHARDPEADAMHAYALRMLCFRRQAESFRFVSAIWAGFSWSMLCASQKLLRKSTPATLHCTIKRRCLSDITWDASDTDVSNLLDSQIVSLCMKNENEAGLLRASTVSETLSRAAEEGFRRPSQPTAAADNQKRSSVIVRKAAPIDAITLADPHLQLYSASFLSQVPRHHQILCAFCVER